MNNVLRLAIVDPSDSSRESLKSTLLGLDMVWLEAECSRYDFFSDVVVQTNPDVGFIAMDDDPERAIELVGELQEKAPDCSILVCSSSTDGNLILRAMRGGVKEFLPQPVQLEDLVSALERISQHKYGSSDSRNRGCKIIAVAGCTGGVGSTSLAVNLGCQLAADENNSVALVDLDLCLGDADVFLDTIPDYSLADLAQNVSRLDFNLLKRSLTKHSSGLYLLPRPMQLEDVPLITSEDLSRVLGLMKASFTHLVLDTSKSFNSIDKLAMEMADDVLLVTQLDLPCLRNVVRLVMSFEHQEGMKDKTKIIVNRVGLDNGQISLKKAQETIGSEIYWQLPNDYRTMVEVRNNGVPLVQQAPKAAIAQSIRMLAEALCGNAEEQGELVGSKEGKSSRWLSLWPGKSN